jgi:hypothetical protein
MHIYVAILLSLSLSACSWIVDPEFPEQSSPNQPGVDMRTAETDLAIDPVQMDMMRPVDVSMVPSDAGIMDATSADVAVDDVRTCQNWSTCYAGESCLNFTDDGVGACGNTPDEDTCNAGNTMNTPSTRTFTDDCCVPDDGENRGECVFPYTLEFDVREVQAIASPSLAKAQFSGGVCRQSIANFEHYADVVFISNTSPEITASTICVEASIPFGEAYDFQLYRLDTCCEQGQEFTEESCGFAFEASETEYKRFLNMPVIEAQTEIRFGLKFGFTTGPDGTVNSTPTLSMEVVPMSYKIHAGPCCNDTHPCSEEFNCEAGICE